MDNSRIEAILNNDYYKELLNSIEIAEINREFCRHGMDHCADVARVAYILNLEKGYNIPKDIIYATALLHDIGRGSDNHNVKSAEIADIILQEASFNSLEIEMIKDAILHHRHSDVSDKEMLADIISRADRYSRKCFECKVANQCYWDDNDKNTYLQY